MNHADHVELLHDGILDTGGVWADFGAGTGAFTLALAGLIGPSAQIYAVDKEGAALQRLEQRMSRQFPNIALHTRTADFTRPLELSPLDGVVMANSLHFVRRKEKVVKLIRGYLRPDGRLIVVEYNTDRGNRWVPHPLSYATWEEVAARAGFIHTRLLAIRPSSFLGQFYSALSVA